ncbi:MAG: MmcQ/YjbR family DNA-binding protein [Sulfurovum sp.]
MNLEELEKTLISKNSSQKEFPFNDDVMVFKVMNKMFALLLWKEKPLKINLKCLPFDALAYREIYDCVDAGYHMNKKHWNTITIDGTMRDEILIGMIDESYNLVVDKLTKKEKEKLLNDKR